jgi:hypothetical protein
MVVNDVANFQSLTTSFGKSIKQSNVLSTEKEHKMLT